MKKPRKPYYELAELCDAWSLSTGDIASYVLARELTLSVAVAGQRVEAYEIDEDKRGHYSIPLGPRWIVGTMDLSCTDAWTVLRQGSRDISSFWSLEGERLDLPEVDGDPRVIAVDRAALVVRRAEKERFEDEQGINQPTTAAGLSGDTGSSPRSRGAPAKYDWEGCWCEIAATIYDPGVPATQAEWLEMLRNWFIDRLGADNIPSDSSIKQRLSKIWPRVKPDVSKPSAKTLIAGARPAQSPEKGRTPRR